MHVGVRLGNLYSYRIGVPGDRIHAHIGDQCSVRSSHVYYEPVSFRLYLRREIEIIPLSNLDRKAGLSVYVNESRSGLRLEPPGLDPERRIVVDVDDRIAFDLLVRIERESYVMPRAGVVLPIRAVR